MELYEVLPVPSIRLKTRSPLMYWVRVLLFAYVVVHLSLVMVDHVAATTETLDVDSAIDDLCLGPSDPMIGVCPSNRWYVPYIGQGDLNISWSDDNGTTWNSSTIVSDGWKGETHMSVVGIQTWSNNTTVVMVRTEGADHDYDLYLFWLWGDGNASEAGDWNYTSFASGASVVRYGSMIFNSSGILHLVWNEVSAIRHQTWDVADGTLGSETLWLAVNAYPMIQCDYNDDVWVAYQVSSKLWVQDYDQVVTMSINDPTGTMQWGSFFITGDNTKVLTGYRQYLSNHYFRVAYEAVVNTTLTYNEFQSDTDDWNVNYYAGGNVYGEKTVSVVQLRVETGSEEFVEYRAAYDAIDGVWESSETVLWTIPTDDDMCYHYGNCPSSVWPQIDGTSVNILTSGRFHYWLYKDELGASDDWMDILYWNNPTFAYWDWSPPEEPPEEPEEPSSIEDVPSLMWWDGDMCRTWVLGLFVIIVAIGLFGIVGRSL